MNELKTSKSVKIATNGLLTIDELEFEAAQRNNARMKERNAQMPPVPTKEDKEGLLAFYHAAEKLREIPLPAIEPLRTWEVGFYELVDTPLGKAMGTDSIRFTASQWVGQRTIPLSQSDIDELRAHLLENYSHQFTTKD